MRIEESPLSTRVSNALRRQGYTEIEEILQLSEEKIRSFRNLGAKSCAELLAFLRTYSSDEAKASGCGKYPENITVEMIRLNYPELTAEFILQNNVPIELLDLPPRLRNVLRLNGLRTV